mmetsp:Transcript_21086/g.44482  ORF Transcript_21086/g.44482 Transcript_21086/m.44482 type:complete len:91 (+) Transcript_21086:1079-1351(+)
MSARCFRNDEKKHHFRHSQQKGQTDFHHCDLARYYKSLIETEHRMGCLDRQIANYYRSPTISTGAAEHETVVENKSGERAESELHRDSTK